MLSESSRKFCTNVGIIPEEAKSITIEYFESLGLDYQISYGNPKMGDVFLIDSEKFGSNTLSVDYEIPVSLNVRIPLVLGEWLSVTTRGIQENLC